MIIVIECNRWLQSLITTADNNRRLQSLISITDFTRWLLSMITIDNDNHWLQYVFFFFPKSSRGRWKLEQRTTLHRRNDDYITTSQTTARFVLSVVFRVQPHCLITLKYRASYSLGFPPLILGSPWPGKTISTQTHKKGRRTSASTA